MRNWKIIMMVLCLALCLPGLFGMAEAKGSKDMVKEKLRMLQGAAMSVPAVLPAGTNGLN